VLACFQCPQGLLLNKNNKPWLFMLYFVPPYVLEQNSSQQLQMIHTNFNMSFTTLKCTFITSSFIPCGVLKKIQYKGIIKDS